MKIAIGVLLTFLCADALAAGTKLETTDCDFGEAYAFNQVQCDLTFNNVGDTPIRVSELRSDKPEEVVEPAAVTVAPHAKAYIKATVSTGNDIGRIRHIFHFRSDEKEHENRVVAARGFVVTALDQGRPIVDLGVVDLANELPTRKVELTSHDAAGFRVEKVISSPPYVDARIDADGQGVTLKLRANAPWGYQGEFVKLSTNAPIQREVWVGVQADVHGVVVPASNPLNVGVMRVGSSNEQMIRLTSKNAKDFSVGHIELDKLHGSAGVEPCKPVAEGCKVIRLHISDEQPIGSMIGKVLVDLPEFSQHLLIAVNGIFLGKDAKIDKIEAADLVNKANEKDGKSGASGQTVDISKAIKNAVQNADDAPPSGAGPLLKWSVVNEGSIHGYQIFRASDENGPFVLLNRPTIAIKNQDGGSSYQYRDNTAQSGKTYWYYVGIVYNNGRKQELTGPQKVVAK